MTKLMQRLNPGQAFNGLWRNRDFMRLWTSLTITHFGGQITFLALPLTAALLLDATPFEMGVLTALEAVLGVSGRVMAIALALIVVGCIATIVRRTRRLLHELEAR